MRYSDSGFGTSTHSNFDRNHFHQSGISLIVKPNPGPINSPIISQCLYCAIGVQYVNWMYIPLPIISPPITKYPIIIASIITLLIVTSPFISPPVVTSPIITPSIFTPPIIAVNQPLVYQYSRPCITKCGLVTTSPMNRCEALGAKEYYNGHQLGEEKHIFSE
jgi:hypothetical protein